MRLGKFTGKLYSEDYDFSKCPECCLCISDSQAKDEEFISRQKAKNLVTCLSCMGCPASK